MGIVSFGTRYCGQGTPGVYTRVAAFLEWIESNMKEWNQHEGPFTNYVDKILPIIYLTPDNIYDRIRLLF